MNRDTALWESFRNGDKEAFAILFRTYYPLLFQFGVKVTTDSALLEDCIQELFADIWQSRLPPPVLSVKAYLFKSLRYKLIRVMRNNRHQSSLENVDDYHFELSHEHFVITNQESREKSDNVKSALSFLSNRQKEIIYLKYYQDLSYDEICTITDLNYQVARNLLSQAVKSLKRIISKEAMVVCIFSLLYYN